MKLRVELDREEDGRWIADIPDVPGAMAYGVTEQEAVRKAKSIALCVLSDRASREDFDSVEFSRAALA